MKKINIYISVFLLSCFSLSVLAEEIKKLPEDIVWETNNSAPIFSSEKAKKGGTYRAFIDSFPPTLRTVGPDSNSSFRSAILNNQLELVNFHPDTEEIIPQMATHWAYGKDGKTLYYKLDPDARWSDGKPVTADDYLFTLEFMRSKFIRAPWYNNHYSEQIKDVIKFDDYTIAIIGATAKPQKDLHWYYGLSPTPKHFHKLDEKWVEENNWKISPNTGPYQISDLDKGKSITFMRKKDWWAKDKRYFKNRFNVDKVEYKVIRDVNIAYKHFEKGELDTFNLVLPEYWHKKGKGKYYQKGYIEKIWFYNDIQQPSSGMYLNQDDPLLKDKNIRLGLAHSINVDKTIKTILRNDYEHLQHGYVGYGEYSNNYVKARLFDLKKADEYFTKAGWGERGGDGIRVKEGKRLSFTVTYSQKHHTDRLVIIKEEARKVGVELNLQQLDGTAAFKKILEKKHQIAWMGWSTGFRPAFWQHYHSDNAHKPQTNNITNTDNKELDEMIMAYRFEVDTQKRIDLSKKIQQKIYEEAAYIPTYSVPYTREAKWRWVKLPEHIGTKSSGGLFSPFSSSVGGLFWIDEDEKKATLKAKKKGRKYPQVIIKDTRYKAI